MDDIISKISSYNIFNNLVPGAVIAYLLATLGIYTIDTNSIVTDLIVFYFVGMIVSRFGSLVVEPILKAIGFIEYSKYEDYLLAVKKDTGIPTLMEVNNQYRTFVAMFTLVAIVFFSQRIIEYFQIPVPWVQAFTVMALFILFALSFRKQTAFIKKRVEHQK